MIKAVVIAGPDGAGKTTFARQMVPLLYPGVPFLNTDEIQMESRAYARPEAAGREFLRRLESLELRHDSFALETTLSGKLYARRMVAWRGSGYRIYLHFIQLPSADFAVGRVAKRVATGGHAVPEADVRRRYDRGLELFERLYKPLADEWHHWFSDDGGLRLGGYHRR